MATVSIKRREYSAARELAAHAVAIWESALGPNHMNTAFGLFNLAQCYAGLGDLVSSEALLRRNIQILGNITPGHVRLADSLKELANLFVAQGKYPGAEKLLRRALAIREASDRASAPELVAVRQSLVDVLRLQRRYTEARKLEGR
jgi:tetratricopeptide (TPR) repeat protein